MNEQDERWMSRAIELALMGKGQVDPNPLVGCVIVHNNKIIAEGFHRKFGEPHAEVNAVNSITDTSLIPASKVYVTLEPCAHHGKTPPCTDLLIKSGFKSVVVGSVDPNHKVAGKGIAKLRQAAIEVTVGVLKKNCEEINAFFFEAHLHKKPYYLLKWAQSQDGFIFNPSKKRQLSGTASQQLVHELRSEYQGILIGKRTAINDNPSLTVRLHKGRTPIRMVVMHEWDVILENGKLFKDGFSTLYFNTSKEGKLGNKEWIRIPPDKPWKTINQILLSRGINSVLVEGGTQILTQLIEENWWNEIIRIDTKVLLEGGLAGPEFEGKIESVKIIGNDQWSRYINMH